MFGLPVAAAGAGSGPADMPDRADGPRDKVPACWSTSRVKACCEKPNTTAYMLSRTALAGAPLT